MVFSKSIKITTSAMLILGLVLGQTCFAEELDAEQKVTISQNCTHINESLRQLQRVDSRTRTYLGTAYESISSRFITPLNLRLVKLGRPSATLFEIQTNFTAAQAQFRDRYVDYMRHLENLIAIDCSAQPEEFYHQLVTTRQKREDLRLSTKRLTELAKDQYEAVVQLKGDL